MFSETTFHIAVISTNVETNNPLKELDPAFEILGPVLEKFVTVKKKKGFFYKKVSDMYLPADDGTQDNIFVSASYDPTPHFEN